MGLLHFQQNIFTCPCAQHPVGGSADPRGCPRAEIRQGANRCAPGIGRFKRVRDHLGPRPPSSPPADQHPSSLPLHPWSPGDPCRNLYRQLGPESPEPRHSFERSHGTQPPLSPDEQLDVLMKERWTGISHLFIARMASHLSLHASVSPL